MNFNLERKVMHSFFKVKNDMMKLQNDIAILTQNQEKIIEWMTDAREREMQLYEKLKELREAVEKKTKSKGKK